MTEKKREALNVKQIIRRGVGVAAMALALAAGASTSARAVGLMLPYPLHTSGSQIVDSNGTPVRICSVGWNWYEGQGTAPNSINTAGYKPMFQALVANGINCVRLCTCDQQVATNPVITSINTSLNPDLAGLRYNQILQTMVNYGGSIGLKFVIESHNNEGSNNVNFGAQNPRGIWYDSGVPGGDGTDGGGNTATVTNSGFTSIWQTRANLFNGNTAVIGYDLVNEPFYGTITWGDGNVATDIRNMYQTVGNAILAIDSAKLIICEGGQNYGAGLPEGDLTKVTNWPVNLNVANRVVYSDHVYPSEVAGFSPDSGSGWVTRMNTDWGFLVTNGIAPVWIGECGDNMRTSDGTTYANGFISYLNGQTAGGPSFSGNQQGVSWSWWDLEGVQTSGVPNFGILNSACNGIDTTQMNYWNQIVYVSKGGGSTNGPVSVNAGGPAASPFVADADFSGGTTATNWTGAIDTTAVTSPAPQAVYQSERYGAMTYTFPGLTANGSYKVRLHFCENFFTVSGQRTFNVAINGGSVLSNFDIFATAGAIHKANIQQFVVNANGSGQVIISFTNVVNNALVNGLDVQVNNVIPPIPTGLTATGGNSQVALSWNASTGATAYDVKRSTVSGSGYVTVTSPTGTTYTNTGLTNGTTYYFVVDAKNTAGTSGNSAQASAAPVGPVQAQIANATTAPVIDGNNTDAVWSTATSYNINNIAGTVSSGADLSATVKAAWDTTNLYVLVDVTDDVKNNDSTNPWDDDSVELYLDADHNGGTVYDANDRQIIFGWGDAAAVEGGGRGISGVTFAKADPSGTTYRIEAKIPWAVEAFTATANAIIGIDVHVNDDDDGGARDGKKMWYDTTDTAYANPSVFGSGKLVAGGGTAPPAPTGLAAAPGNTQIALTWNSSTGATSYNVYRGTAAGAESGTAIATGIATTSYTNTGLINGTHYYYTVKAVNANGTSGASNEANATPVAPPAIAFVQVNSNCPVTASSIPVAFNTAQVAGHFNVVVVGWNDLTGTVSSVTDSAGNTYTRAIGPTVGGAQQISIYYAPNIHAGANTVTVTMSGTMDYPDVRILEYAGLTTVDKTAGASGSSTTSNSGSVTTTAANELIFSANNVSNSTASAGAGFTSRLITIDGDIAEDQIVSSTGTFSGTANINGTANNWVAQIVTFK